MSERPSRGRPSRTPPRVLATPSPRSSSSSSSPESSRALQGSSSGRAQYATNTGIAKKGDTGGGERGEDCGGQAQAGAGATRGGSGQPNPVSEDSFSSAYVTASSTPTITRRVRFCWNIQTLTLMSTSRLSLSHQTPRPSFACVPVPCPPPA